MVKTINVGGRELIFAANAATPYRYKQLFNEDLFEVFTTASKSGEEESFAMADVITRLAYIMTRQAEKADMNAISMDDFIAWLEDFGPMDIVLAGEEILNFYLSTTNGSIVPKKK